MFSKPVYQTFLNLLNIPAVQNIFESMYDDDSYVPFVGNNEDVDDEFEQALRNQRTMYFIKQPRNAMNFPQELTYTNIMNNVIDKLMDKANEEMNAVGLNDYYDDISALESIAFFINKLMKNQGNDQNRRRMCHGLAEAFYRYPLTAMAYKFANYDGMEDISVGKSRNGKYIWFSQGIKSIVFKYIPYLCKGMEAALAQYVMNPKPDEIACNWDIEPLDKNHVDGDATGINKMLERLKNDIENIHSADDIDSYYKLMTSTIDRCNTAHSLNAALEMLSIADDHFNDMGYPQDSEDRLDALVAMVNKWKSRNWYVDISDENQIEFHAEETVYCIDIPEYTVDSVRQYTDLQRVTDVDVENDNRKSYDSYDDRPYNEYANDYTDYNPVVPKPYSASRIPKTFNADDKKPVDVQRNVQMERPHKVLSPESEVKREAKRSMIPCVLEKMKEDGFTNLPDVAWITAVSKIISKYNHFSNPIDSDEHINQVVNALENKKVPSEVFQEMRRIKNAINRNNNQNNRSKPFNPKRW